MNPTGPGAAYTLLFDDDHGSGLGLPAAFRTIYGGDWHMPAAPAHRPHLFTNFVVSHDGRISFDEPGHAGGGDISRHASHDSWLMGLLRARADAIVTGAGTLRVARRHLWTPEQVFAADGLSFAALRAVENRPAVPLLVVVSESGELPADAYALRGEAQPVLVATTTTGAARAQALLGDRPGVWYHAPGDTLNLATLLSTLRADYGVGTLLSEGGARLYGALIAAHLIDEVFLTTSPIVVGSPPVRAPRPTLVEGVGFSPDDPPRLQLVSLRRYGDYLFQRARFLG